MFISLGCTQLDTEDVITKDQTFISSQIPTEGGEGMDGQLVFLFVLGLIYTYTHTHV